MSLLNLDEKLVKILEQGQVVINGYYAMLLGHNVEYMGQSLYIKSYTVTEVTPSFKAKVFVTLTDFNGFVVRDISISGLQFYEDEYSNDLTDFNTFLLNNGNTEITTKLAALQTQYKMVEKVLDVKKICEGTDIYKNAQDHIDNWKKNKGGVFPNVPQTPTTKPFTLDDAYKIICNNKDMLNILLTDPKTKELAKVLSKLIK